MHYQLNGWTNSSGFYNMSLFAFFLLLIVVNMENTQLFLSLTHDGAGLDNIETINCTVNWMQLYRVETQVDILLLTDLLLKQIEEIAINY